MPPVYTVKRSQGNYMTVERQIEKIPHAITFLVCSYSELVMLYMHLFADRAVNLTSGDYNYYCGVFPP